jgi:hypothetical protein
VFGELMISSLLASRVETLALPVAGAKAAAGAAAATRVMKVESFIFKRVTERMIACAARCCKAIVPTRNEFADVAMIS